MRILGQRQAPEAPPLEFWRCPGCDDFVSDTGRSVRSV
jgi:hypothetical protein